MGGDLWGTFLVSIFINFNPRLRMGGDSEGGKSFKDINFISIHASVWEATY